MYTDDKEFESLFAKSASDIKLGLKNTAEAYEVLKKPASDLTTVLVGGTNGKGSTCRRLIERAASDGYKVGLYSSPHIRFFRERFYLSHTEVDNQELSEHLKTLKEKLGPPLYSKLSFFEISTLLAAVVFAEQRVDLAIFEVGLGGRLDATNVLRRDLVLLTSIGLDHTDFLGPTLKHIAVEKAGLIRNAAPTLLSPQLCLEAQKNEYFHVFEEAATATNSTLRCVGFDEGLPLCPSEAEYQRSNFALADAAYLSLKESSLLQPSQSQRSIPRPWRSIPTAKARFEFYEHPALGWLLLDVCHNPHGAEALVRSIQSHKQPPLLLEAALVSILADKDADRILTELTKVVRRIALVGFDHPRGWSPAHIQTFSAQSKLVYTDFKQAFGDILRSNNASNKKFSKSSPLLICGSVHIFSAVLSELEQLHSNIESA